MQEQAPGTHDVQPSGRKRLAARNSDANGRDCADSVCECRSKRPALPTMCNLSAGSVWPPGIRMPTVEIALILCVKTLILCVNAGASARHPRCAAQRQEASDHQESDPNGRDALILCVNTGASDRHPRCAARYQGASGSRQEFRSQR